jgi:hypothetical protein
MNSGRRATIEVRRAVEGVSLVRRSSVSLRTFLPAALAFTLVAACGGSGSEGGSGPAGLATAFDSTADTITARVDGDVPLSALRTIVAEMRIAPSMDDTSLFAEVTTFEVDQADRIWLFDFQGRRLFLFDSTGRLVRRIGRQGQGPGEFSSGNGMVVRPEGGVALLDARNARVSFFDAAGEFQSSWPVPSGFSTSNGLVTDRSHQLFLRRPVTPPREGEILGRMGLVRLRDGGAFGDSLAPPDLPVPREVYLAVSPDGNSRSSTSSSYAPNYHWSWHPGGFFVVAHGGRYEITLARTDRKPIVIRRASPPVPVLPDERAEEQERITWGMRQTQPGWSWSGPAIPDTKPPLGGMTLARDGTIWVRVATPSERIPDAELAPQREKGPPVRRFRSSVTYEVFGPDGRFLGRIPLPPRTTIVQADGNMVWGITRDEDDLPAVVRYRVEPPFGMP